MDKEMRGKNILITGGTGSIGVKLIQAILKFEPSVVRVFSNDEDGLYKLEQRLETKKNIRLLFGDVRDISRLHRAMENVDIVFHLSALKHVPTCEYNPFEAVKTNVLGTENLVEVAIEEEVDKVIFTSSDKATNPTSVLGATKLLAEKLVTAANYHKGPRKTTFSSVRLGNVLGSRGSIIPLLKMQIENHRSISITNPAMTRFIMPMDEVIRLMFKALQIMFGGEVFVFKMHAVRLMDLADVIVNSMAAKRNLKSEEVSVKVTGVRPGEKLHEELMNKDEAGRAFELDDMLVVLPHIPQLFDTLRDHYIAMGAKLCPPKSYSSNDEELLTKEEIKNLLSRLHII